jgi:hypothetical protein
LYVSIKLLKCQIFSGVQLNWAILVPEEKTPHVCVSFNVIMPLFFMETAHFLMFRVAPGFPDQRTCLFHQKLQMLNCCLKRKQARELAAREVSVEDQAAESGKYSFVFTSV